MSNKLNNILAFMAAGVAALSAAQAANEIIERAKDQCIVGEQADGYLGIVDQSAADTAVKREVRSVNQQRKAFYSDLARRNGVSVEVTATLTAEKLLAEASRSRECTRGADGKWTKR